MTLANKDSKEYAQLEAPGTIDHLVDMLREKLHRPLPAADLLMSDVYEQLMENVVDVKDLGSGYVGGVECNHLAFRAKDVDWQIWIAEGEHPYPCRYVITSTKVKGAPQYSVEVRNWKTGTGAPSSDFTFKAPDGYKEVKPDALADTDELPAIFKGK